MPKKALARDMYMQFKDVSVEYDGSDSSVLVEGQVDTGLSVRGQLIWLVHLVEFFFADDEGASQAQYVRICTRRGLVVLPDIGDNGVISGAERQLVVITSGTGFTMQPLVNHYLPPIPLASPQLSIYAETRTNEVTLRGDTVEARLGFTTAPLDSAAYTEIAETWGW